MRASTRALVAEQRARRRRARRFACRRPAGRAGGRRAPAPPSSAAASRRFASSCSGTDAKRSMHLLRELAPADACRRARRSAPGSAPRARGSPRRRARGTPRPRARAGRARRRRRPDLARDRAAERKVRSGSSPSDRGQVELEHALEPEPARDALVRDRRVDVAVADHRRAALERRPDHLARRAARERPRRAAPRPRASRGRRAGRGRGSARRARCRPARASRRPLRRRPPAARAGAPPASSCPEPSRPSKETNIGRILRRLLNSAWPCKRRKSAPIDPQPDRPGGARP